MRGTPPRVRPAAGLAAIVGGVLVGAWAPPTWAIEDGQPFDTSEYTIDLHQGPVLAGSRVVGLAGAYAPIAEGVAGYAYNPASVVARVPWSTAWHDWELDGGFTLPTSLSELDFDNNGDSSFTNTAAFFATGGLGLQFGDVGVGINLDWQLYQVETETDILNVSLVRGLLVLGYSFLDGELLTGLGLSANNISIERAIAEAESGEDRTVATVMGPAAHGGVVWAPNYLPIRVGVAARLSLPASQQPDAVPECNEEQGCIQDGDDFYVEDDTKPGGRFYLPRTVSLPNEIHAGVALQLFRQLNQGWANPKDEPSHHRRAKEEIERAREAREIERERLIQEATARGESIDVVEDRLDQSEDHARYLEEERLDAAYESDWQRRLIPYKTMPRERLLLSLAMKLTWSTENGVGLDSFLEHQEVERSGEHVTVGPHFGVEGEAWPGYLVLRGGSYFEPTRFERGSGRWHGTGGLDLHIPIEWGVFGLFDDDTSWRLGGAVDGTVRYFGWNVSFGVWR
ncbi:MAG: hypothetical protein JRI68_34390 [Deltaproteobacteria bacterium]|nr:hypothetical protein [Deltaproteobacteria bacterium]